MGAFKSQLGLRYDAANEGRDLSAHWCSIHWAPLPRTGRQQGRDQLGNCVWISDLEGKGSTGHHPPREFQQLDKQLCFEGRNGWYSQRARLLRTFHSLWKHVSETAPRQTWWKREQRQSHPCSTPKWCVRVKIKRKRKWKFQSSHCPPCRGRCGHGQC